MTEMRLEQWTETNLAHLREMPKEMSLACLSDGLMAMRMVQLMDLRSEKLTETNLAHLREMMSLVCLSDGLMGMQSVLTMEIHLETLTEMLTELLMETSLVHLLDWQTEMRTV
jgi:hypothetical protein